MKSLTDILDRVKVDALYGKKKHFNASDRKEAWHQRIGIPLVVINILSGSVLLYALTDSSRQWSIYVPMLLSFVAAILGGIQTYLNLPRKIEGHRRVGNKYLAVMKSCNRLKAYSTLPDFTVEDLKNGIEELSNRIAEINEEAESFPTSDTDYLKAREGISDDEESYTTKELDV